MNCQKIKILFDDYLEGKLKQSEHDIVNRHLQSCQKCSHSYDLYKEALEIIKDDREILLQTDFLSGIKTKLSAVKEEKGKVRNLSFLYAVAASFLILISVFTGFLIGNAYSTKYDTIASEINIEEELFMDDLDFNFFND